VTRRLRGESGGDRSVEDMIESREVLRDIMVDLVIRLKFDLLSEAVTMTDFDMDKLFK
jgi:hypothetical protein